MSPVIYIFAIFLAYRSISVSSYDTADASDNLIQKLGDQSPFTDRSFGEITGVLVNKDDNIIVFHRGSRGWNSNHFDQDKILSQSDRSPIPDDTIAIIDQTEEKIVSTWGGLLFYVPVGLSLDSSGANVWLTDVGLHQVFKYSLDGSRRLLSLGTRFVPGNDGEHFCQPASVADSGELVFVADGFCNQRVARFSASGMYLGDLSLSPEPQFASTLRMYRPARQEPFWPGKLVYARELNKLCVADHRGRDVRCYSFDPTPDSDERIVGEIVFGGMKLNFTIKSTTSRPDRLMLDYSANGGGVIAALWLDAGDEFGRSAHGGFYNATNGQLMSQFNLPEGILCHPNDLAISDDSTSSIIVAENTQAGLLRFTGSKAATPQFFAYRLARQTKQPQIQHKPITIAEQATSSVDPPPGFIEMVLKASPTVHLNLIHYDISEIPLTCGGKTDRNESFFVNPQYPSEENGTHICHLTVEKSSNVCQLRLDFEEFSLAQPDHTGQCTTDSFTVRTLDGEPLPVLCGENSGQHMYVSMERGDSDSVKLTTVINGDDLMRKWKIKISLIPCDSLDLAPFGCLQYYRSQSAVVRSFNYGPKIGGQARYLSDLGYSSCVRGEEGFCSIRWETEQANSFSFGAPYIYDLNEAGTSGASCSPDDFIGIDQASSEGVGPGEDRFCGPDLMDSGKLISRSKPFLLKVRSNGDHSRNVQKSQVGFSLRYIQLPCMG